MRPLILDYAIPRRGNVIPNYEYDFAQSVNTISIDGNDFIFITSKRDDISLLTKTKQSREGDDQSSDVLELTTKTAQERERDEQDMAVLELETKTEIDKESDEVQNSLIELMAGFHA